MVKVNPLKWEEDGEGRYRAFPFGKNPKPAWPPSHFHVKAIHKGAWMVYAFKMDDADWSVLKEEDGKTAKLFDTAEEAMKAAQHVWDSFVTTLVED